MKLYMAGTASRQWIPKELFLNEDIFGRSIPLEKRGGYDPIIKKHKPFILESFYYADKDTERLLPYYGDFLLDSGAFTFMQDKKTHTDWEDYTRRYADFINKNKVEKFFELDIDSVVGYRQVLELRELLESLTNRKCIPVWHRSRGTEEFVKASKEYPYVALGGLVDGAKKGDYAKKLWKYFPWFIRTAHDNGAKIHALGFTSIEGLKQYHFDSVDSTAWTTGNRFGYLFKFDGQTIRKIERPPGKKLSDARMAALYNYIEWIKFQKWALTHL